MTKDIIDIDMDYRCETCKTEMRVEAFKGECPICGNGTVRELRAVPAAPETKADIDIVERLRGMTRDLPTTDWYDNQRHFARPLKPSGSPRPE